MRGEVLRVLSVSDEPSQQHYGATLFTQSEAQPGPCTARSTLYIASLTAGLMLHQFARWLRGSSLMKDSTLSLLGQELVTG